MDERECDDKETKNKEDDEYIAHKWGLVADNH